MSIHIHRIYTRAGDGGQTALAGGVKVSKSSVEVESYGESDELISHLGVVRAQATDSPGRWGDEIASETDEMFLKIQNTLYEAGAVLASRQALSTDAASYDPTNDPRVTLLESRIDAYREAFEAIDGFTIPGDCLLNAHAHVARTVCRRWERVLVRRHELAPIEPWVLAYSNRLSDYLFAYTRWVTAKLASDEKLWKGRATK
ncbi:cob(I)yrinic acid a,c-diamide adenosyltransferase [Blastopirellula marina]|uniref:Corrinoid adenosyltransferase n=1 Tax=Blastopirellula marina TaxID=124 RepID=A0A2S8GVX1_9BACT|nr:cob(I)yrinic acid a,c-diamide adenosyltransferase [Blastopirellula marina]PQO48194.1 ATP:cob(I)alamin adenosyltransferase [Blastopirellula marina]